MNYTQNTLPHNLFGVFELDTAGNVLYYGKIEKKRLTAAQPDLVGRNLFEELRSFKIGGKLRKRFRCFVKGSLPMSSFKLNLNLRRQILEARVLMVRVRTTRYDKNDDLIVIDVRKI